MNELRKTALNLLILVAKKNINQVETVGTIINKNAFPITFSTKKWNDGKAIASIQ
jgi:hypothetical protein